MKNIIILGGNNSINISWLKKMKKSYEKNYQVYDVHFDNWKDNSSLNFEIELKKLEIITKDLNGYYVIAKSAGSLLALMAIKLNIIPKKIVIMGLPLKYAKLHNIDVNSLLLNASKKSSVLIIQQKNDPQGKFKNVKEIIPNLVYLKEIPGSQHTYGKIDYIKEIVDDFLDD